MAYTKEQYQAQSKTMQTVGQANASGLCAVCQKRPRSPWQDTGELRMTCGARTCFIAWLPVKGEHEDQNHHTAE